MRARDDDSTELNADFAVEADGSDLSLVLESAGGRTAGSGRPRNDQYVPALRLLLRRLGDRDAVLLSALVASARLAALPEADPLPGVHAIASPPALNLTPVNAAATRDPEFAVLDSTASVKVRREQAQLRSMLANGRELAGCALCGHQYPLRRVM